jgi:hypothetical protein
MTRTLTAVSVGDGDGDGDGHLANRPAWQQRLDRPGKSGGRYICERA